MTIPLAQGVNRARKACLVITLIYLMDFIIMAPSLNLSLLFGAGNDFSQGLWRDYSLFIGLHAVLFMLLLKPFAPAMANHSTP